VSRKRPRLVGLRPYCFATKYRRRITEPSLPILSELKVHCWSKRLAFLTVRGSTRDKEIRRGEHMKVQYFTVRVPVCPERLIIGNSVYGSHYIENNGRFTEPKL
jgi:hypothetical protein